MFTQHNHVPNWNRATQFDHGECRNDCQDSQIGDTKGLEILGNLLTQVQRFDWSSHLFGGPSRTGRRRLEQGNGTKPEESAGSNLFHCFDGNVCEGVSWKGVSWKGMRIVSNNGIWEDMPIETTLSHKMLHTVPQTYLFHSLALGTLGRGNILLNGCLLLEDGRCQRLGVGYRNSRRGNTRSSKAGDP